MLRSLRFALALALTGATLASSLSMSTAVAQDDRARFHFQAGTSYYEAGDYEDALREFDRAYALSQRHQLLYNLSLCHQQLGNLDEAANFLERYLNQVEEIPNRANLERRLENFRRRAAETETETETETGTGTGTETEAGTGTGTETETETETGTGDTYPADEPEDATHDDTPTEQPSSGGGPNVAAIAAFAAGGVGALLAVITGPMALGEASSLEDQGCGERVACDAGTLRTLAGLADAGVALAAVGVTLGVVFLFTMGDDDEDEASATLRFAPYADHQGAGAVLIGSF